MKYNKPNEARLIDHKSGTVIKGYGRTIQEAQQAAERLWNEKFGRYHRRW